MKRLTTRSIATAEAIRDREPFRTSGALQGDAIRPESCAPYLDPPGKWVRHRLSEVEWALYDTCRSAITYIVWSFSTPIAYYVEANPVTAAHVSKDLTGWHRVDQTFSPTTTKHQANLYLAIPARTSEVSA